MSPDSLFSNDGQHEQPLMRIIDLIAGMIHQNITILLTD